MIDSKTFAKPPSVENTVNGGGGGGGGSVSGGGGAGDAETPNPPGVTNKNPNKLFGVSPSDIDKYSRVVFPVCFVCFNLMYWIIYLHISEEETQDLIAVS